MVTLVQIVDGFWFWKFKYLSEGFDGPWTGDPSAPAGWSQVVNGDGDGYTSSFYANTTFHLM